MRGHTIDRYITTKSEAKGVNMDPVVRFLRMCNNLDLQSLIKEKATKIHVFLCKAVIFLFRMSIMKTYFCLSQLGVEITSCKCVCVGNS